jgi:hypothetical protein
MDDDARKKKIEERNKQLREREISDVRKLMELPEGRRFLWRVMTEAETFLATPADKRIIGLIVFNDIMKANPEMFIQMQREYRSEEMSFRKTISPDPDEDI